MNAKFFPANWQRLLTEIIAVVETECEESVILTEEGRAEVPEDAEEVPDKHQTIPTDS